MSQPASVVRACFAGVLATALLASCVGNPPPEPVETSTSVPSAITCTDAEPQTIDLNGATWQHPRNSFYEGTEDDIPTEADLEHLLRADNAIVVIYDRDGLPAAAIDPLRDWIYYETAAVAIPSIDEPLAPIEVRYGGAVTLCDGVDTIQLGAFSASRPVGVVTEHGETGAGLEPDEAP